MIYILIFVENCLQYDAIHDFSVGLRIGSNPADINRFLAILEYNFQNILTLCNKSGVNT